MMGGEMDLTGGQKLHKIGHDNGKIQYLFWCPVCDHCHAYDESWKFNGDYDKPTFTPSLLNTKPNDRKDRCHLFVTDGKIKYLNDCSHALAGQEIELQKF